MHRPLVSLASLLASLASVPASGQGVSLEILQGAVIETKTTYSTLSRSPKGTAPATVIGSMRIKVGPAESIEATLTRSVTVNTPVGVKRGVLNRAISGKLGTPGKGDALNFLWVLEGNQLTFLRIMEVGSFKTTITLSETAGALSCTVDSPYVPEVAAGPGKDKSAVFAGGKIEIINVKRVGSTCKVGKRG